ncbi:MAG TPA: FAD-dependent oxidoreductase [Myxococcota bacterium]|nr:FAD-dependent oxidoreductase [Myxococcota bacterium]
MAHGTKVAIVGGGIGGLAAAAFAARTGARVTLFERLSEPGGRARTRNEQGFAFNMGPHALYVGGAAIKALRELDLDPPGRPPATSGGLAYSGGRLHALPGGAVSLLATGLLGPLEKLELGRLLSRLPKVDTRALSGTPLADFIAAEVHSPRVRDTLLSVIRVTSYSHAPERIDAGSALDQLLLGLGVGVRYLDGGWERMVESLAARAREAGAELRAGVRVERVAHDGAVQALELAGGERVPADAVILALGPAEASDLVDGGAHPALAAALAGCVPVRAACMDLGLSSLPRPKQLFALGIERPLYFSVHSAAARLAPEGAALVQLARYLGPDEQPSREEVESELEALLDCVQPGWRERVLTRRVMRDLVVTHDLPQAARGGLRGRTPVAVSGIRNLFLAGDWVGPTGMLADAAFASARAAALAAAGAPAVRAAA